MIFELLDTSTLSLTPQHESILIYYDIHLQPYWFLMSTPYNSGWLSWKVTYS